MIEDEKIRELVQAAVAETLDEHLRLLHDDVVARVMLSIAPTLQSAPPPAPASSFVAGSTASDLNVAIVALQRASQQVEILKTLLEGAAAFSARTALFILRGNMAVGWQARGFADNDVIKAIVIETGSGTIKNVIHDYVIEKVAVALFDPKFASAMGAPLDGECVLVPLVVRGKVAALLYADSGDEGVPVDLAALELLCRAAGDWIELQALRKAAGAPAHYPIPTLSSHAAESLAAPHLPSVSAPEPEQVDVPEPPRVVSTFAAAQASETVIHASAPAVPEPPPVFVAEPAPVPSPAPQATQHLPMPQAPVTVVDPEDEELHKKARRFAKLLVDEIVLYNQHKVLEGRQNHDLYERLKDDIEKSRATYDKRYAQTSVSRADYFTQALIAGLADHNPILLGSTFPR